MFTFLRSVIALVVTLSLAPSVGAFQPEAGDPSQLALPGGPAVVDVSPNLVRLTGQVEVWIQLVDPPLAVANGRNSRQRGGSLSPAQQRQYLQQLDQKQNQLMNQVRSLGGNELGRVGRAHNAIAVRIEARQIGALASLPGILAIRPVVNYELSLADVLPYITAQLAHDTDVDGSGVTVAILDSGIDYTHRNLGGSGVVADYLEAYGSSTADPKNKSRDGLFPTPKVIEGFDFVGEVWPDGPLAPDPDPIDCGGVIPCDGGHGTHVADVAAGRSADGTHQGVAPGASLVAVKVCSSISTACSGLAVLQGLDFALDPNRDGDLSDAVHVINMSLGSAYGQREDDVSVAVRNAVNAGVIVVAAAGNAADRPYITDSPATTPEALSVAATFHPAARLYPITTPSTSPKGGVWQSWSGTPVLTSGALVYDTTSAATRIGCTNADGGNPYGAGSHTGQILLIDRGICNISMKVSNAAASGAIAAIIANNVSQPPCDLPPSFSFGGGTPNIPGYTITLADGNSLKASALSSTASIDPASAAPLAGNMAAFSSRGPSYSFNSIKPDIGGVGTDIVSAEAGTGFEQTPFGGTSASAPVLAGSAALLVQKYPSRPPAELKSLLMNTAEANIGLNPLGCPGIGAPITRIGAGDVRISRALNSKTAAWDAQDLTGSLSFGYHALTGALNIQKTVVVRNYDSAARTYSITPSFRYPDDAASGAVQVSAPASLKVAGNSSASFRVRMKANANRLPVWDLNGGSRGGDGFRLQGFEFDGYLSIADSTDDVHVAWQVLPHRSAEVTPATSDVALTGGTADLLLSNAGGAVNGRVDVFSLLGTSGRFPPPALPGDGDHYAVIDLKSVGVRLAGSAIQFAINTFGVRAHPNYPAEFDIFIDVDRDGTEDFVIFNMELGGFGTTGQNVVAAGPLPEGPFTAFFFTDADLNSGNAILTAPLAAIGLTPSTQFDFSVYAFDNYFTGFATDALTGMTYTPGVPRYSGTGLPSTGVPAGGSSTLVIQEISGGDQASPSQTGLLLMYRDARTQREADAIKVSP